jgi:hypothetical protein
MNVHKLRRPSLHQTHTELAALILTMEAVVMLMTWKSS